MRILLAGSDTGGLAAAFEQAGASVERLDGIVTASSLEAAGIDAADVFVLTDPTEATAIPLARERRPHLSVVVYAEDRLPDFAGHLADLIIHPSAVEPTVVVEEVLRSIPEE